MIKLTEFIACLLALSIGHAVLATTIDSTTKVACGKTESHNFMRMKVVTASSREAGFHTATAEKIYASLVRQCRTIIVRELLLGHDAAVQCDRRSCLQGGGSGCEIKPSIAEEERFFITPIDTACQESAQGEISCRVRCEYRFNVVVECAPCANGCSSDQTLPAMGGQ